MNMISEGYVEVFDAPDGGSVSFEVEGQGALWVSVERFDGQFNVVIDEESTDPDVGVDNLDMGEVERKAIAAIKEKAKQELSDPEALAIEPDGEAWVDGYYMDVDCACCHVSGGKMLVILKKGGREVRYLLNEKETGQVLDQWSQHLTRGGLPDDESVVSLVVGFLEENRPGMPFGLGVKS